MGHVDGYSKKNLIRNLGNYESIENYQREEEHGVIHISYDLVDHVEGFKKGCRMAVATLGILAPAVYVYAKKGVSTECSHYFDARGGGYLGTDRNCAAENLNKKGCKLSQEEDYINAAEYHNNAYHICSSGYKNEQLFKSNRDMAKDKIYARDLNKRRKTKRDRASAKAVAEDTNFERNIFFDPTIYSDAQRKLHEFYYKFHFSRESNHYRDVAIAEAEDVAKYLNCEGTELFDQGNYDEAQKKFQEAYNTSYSEQRYRYEANKNTARIEAMAATLNSEGNILFDRGNYSDAKQKFHEAYNTSELHKEYNRYRINKYKALAEEIAAKYNSEGMLLFNQGKYYEAQRTFQQACDKSQVSKEIDLYRTNENRAKAELEAITLNSHGDDLCNQGKYDEAKQKYQKAYNKSHVIKERNIYKTNKDKTQIIIDELSTIEALWNKAWDAEENGRSADAEKVFQQVLRKCKKSLSLFRDNLRFKQYEALVSLKVAGNKSFNQGLKLQQYGNELFKQAQELKQKKEYELANVKFKEAKNKFTTAQKKFEIGSSHDKRFVSCIKIVQEQINQVIQMIDVTEQHALSQGLQNLKITNINVRRLSSNFRKSESNAGHEYHAQI